jgi:hypothetical protein
VRNIEPPGHFPEAQARNAALGHDPHGFV